MLSSINNFLFKYRAQRWMSSQERERRFVSYKKAKTIFLLFESDWTEKNTVIRKIIQMLQQDNKKVVAWGFIDKKDISTSLLPDFRVLNYKQADLFQKPHSSFFSELEHYEFDLVINLSLNSILPIEYFALYANASCKVGVKKSEFNIYDFLIDVENHRQTIEDSEEELDELFVYNQIIFYLKSIQTSD
jgi:hypothetical protein